MRDISNKKIKKCICGKDVGTVILSARSRVTSGLYMAVLAIVVVLTPFGDMTTDAILPIALVVGVSSYVTYSAWLSRSNGHGFICRLRKSYLKAAGTEIK